MWLRNGHSIHSIQYISLNYLTESPGVIEKEEDGKIRFIYVLSRIQSINQSLWVYPGARVATPTLSRKTGGSLLISLHAGPVPMLSTSRQDLST